MAMMLAEVGARLRAAGLTPRALRAWAGTEHLPGLTAARPRHGELTLLDELPAREPVPAAVALALFVAGRDVAIDRARMLPLDALLAHDLVIEDTHRDVHEDRGRCVRATVAILPVGPSLVVCDRADAPPTAETVCWPDDSSYHLASAIPHAGRVERWLDLATGSGFAPLARPELAREIVGIELNPAAARMARLGAALSGIGHVTIEEADLAVEQAPAPLVSCNLPMPGSGIEMWRFADDDVFERLWRVLPDRIAPGGIAVVHAALATIPHERLAGERVIVRYTPETAARAFGVLWWRPGAPERVIVSQRALTADRPHLDADDR